MELRITDMKDPRFDPKDYTEYEIVEEEKPTEGGLSVQSLGAFPKHINTIQSQLLRRGVVHRQLLPVLWLSLQTRIIAGA